MKPKTHQNPQTHKARSDQISCQDISTPVFQAWFWITRQTNGKQTIKEYIYTKLSKRLHIQKEHGAAHKYSIEYFFQAWAFIYICYEENLQLYSWSFLVFLLKKMKALGCCLDNQRKDWGRIWDKVKAYIYKLFFLMFYITVGASLLLHDVVIQIFLFKGEN